MELLVIDTLTALQEARTAQQAAYETDNTSAEDTGLVEADTPKADRDGFDEYEE